jgi:hypothetical protein
MKKFNYKKWLTENRDGKANINYMPLNEFDDASDGASGPGLTPPGDVEKAMKIVGQFVNNRMEYESLLVAILQFDVPGKKAAITKALKDHPTLRSALLGQEEFSDEENNFQTYKFRSNDEYEVTDGDGGEEKEIDPWNMDTLADLEAKYKDQEGGPGPATHKLVNPETGEAEREGSEEYLQWLQGQSAKDDGTGYLQQHIIEPL